MIRILELLSVSIKGKQFSSVTLVLTKNVLPMYYLEKNAELKLVIRLEGKFALFFKLWT